MVDHAAFAKALPEFADQERFPTSSVSFWLAVLDDRVHLSRFGKARDLAVMMGAAHELTLERQAQDAASNGGVPGLNTGVVNQKSVDKVSVGYDTTASLEARAGYFNQTIYGKRYWSMERRYCGGPVYRVPCTTRTRFML